MTKYQLTKPGGPWDYPTLGFSATNGAILDGTLSTPAISTAPDAYWAVYGGGSAETGITRYGTGTVTPTPEVTDGWVLAYDGTANTYTAQDLGDPESLVGAALSASIDAAIAAAGGGGIPASGDTDGSTDTPLIQAALTAARVAGGGVVTLQAGDTFWLNAALVIGSNTTLDATGATIRLATGADCNMVHNYAYVNPVGTAAISMTGGSGNITYTDGGLFESAVPGQRIKVPGALDPGIYALVAPILTNNTGTNTITVPYLRSSGSGAVSDAVLINPDKNITITGGTWDRGTVAGPDTMDKFTFVLRHVDGLEGSHMTWATTGATGVGGGGSYFWSMADCNNVLVEDITFGIDGANRFWDTDETGVLSDGIHGNGPLRNVVIRDIFGNTGDDMVALMTQDGGDWGDVGGGMHDITIENVYPVNGWQCAVKVLAGPGNLYSYPGMPDVGNVHIRNIGGSCGSRPVWVGDDNRWLDAIDGGRIDNVTIENVSTLNRGIGLNAGTGKGVVLLNGADMGRISLREIFYDDPNSAGAAIEVAATLSDSVSIDQLVIDGLDVRRVGAGYEALSVGTSCVVDELVRTRWRLGTSVPAYDFTGGTVTKIISDTNPVTNAVSRAPIVGRWYYATPVPAVGTATVALTQGKLYVGVPRVEAEDITISQLAIESAVVGSAGAVTRLGIYRIIDQANPYNLTLTSAYATLLVDGGTIATDSGTGAKTITLGAPLLIPAGTWFAIASADQVAGPVTRRYRKGGDYATTPWGGTAAWDSLGYQLVSQSSVTGALPSTFTPAAWEWVSNNGDHGVQFKRSA